MRKLLLATVTAVALGALIGAAAGEEGFMARLVRLEAAAAAPEMAALLAGEPAAVNAVLLEYAGDTALRLNAHLALLRHPGMARAILPVYGLEPEFQEVLERHGPAVLPPVAYFMRHEIGSLRVRHAAGHALSGETRRLWDPTPVERGWYAIAFIRERGHDFLGQFALREDGEVQRVQTERITEAATAFFTGGIRALETRYRVGEDLRASDWLWAGVDVALAAGAAKMLRAGRAAGAGSRAAVTPARAAVAGRAMVGAGRTALRIGKYAVPVAVAYAVVRHPSLISGLAAQAAHLLGWPVALVQGLVWSLVLLPVLLTAAWLARRLLGPAAALLRAAGHALTWLERRTAARPLPPRSPRSVA